MKIVRVFPRRTKATPDDELAFVGDPPLFRPEADEVHVSCTFTWDKPEAERLANAWRNYYPSVSLGGPAYYARGGDFAPGMYLKPGYTITSRGCPNCCDFCLVPEREGRVRILPIREGWTVADNNLLACPRAHIEAVMEMLSTQSQGIVFSGGIEAARLRPWWVKQVVAINLKRLYLAFDQPRQTVAVERAVDLLRGAGLGQRQVGCYVLVGFQGDMLQAAGGRLQWVFEIGATPFAMYYRGPHDLRPQVPKAWRSLVREWSRPSIIFSRAEAQA